MKEIKKELTPPALEGRLKGIADSIVVTVAHELNVISDSAFEKASDEFGLAYGVGKLLEKSTLLTNLTRFADAKGQELVNGLDALIGDALLLRDYIQRNGYLVTDPATATPVEQPLEALKEMAKEVFHSVAGTASDVKQEVESVVQKVEEAFIPDIPQTTEGEQDLSVKQ